MNLKTKIKKGVEDLNNFFICFFLFYLGVGISSLFWKLRSLFVGGGKKYWKEDEELKGPDDMKKLY